MCLASDTEVRTTKGDKRVGDIQIGDILYDPENRPSPVIGVAPPATALLKLITYRQFNSRNWSSFICAPDYRLTLTTTGTRSSITRNDICWFTRCDRKLPLKEARDLNLDILTDSSSMELDKAAQDRFAAIRMSLNTINCDCGGLRRVHRRFDTEELAQLALKILQSDRHHLLDPLIVRDGEEFSMTVEEYERLCCKAVKRDHLKLYRAPLACDPSTASSDPQALPLDGYFLGLWFGDGRATTTAIAFSQEGAPKFSLTKELNSAAGTKMRNEYVTNRDVFNYKIVSRQGGSNPVLDGLRELGVLGNKKAGIPRAYMEADEDTRLKVIAGLMDSDGCYDKSANRYSFSQMTEGHKKIKSIPWSTKKSLSPGKPLQQPDSRLNARNSTSVTAMKETYLDPSENVLVESEWSTAAMVLLGDDERGLIPSDDEDTPDSVMPDVSDEPNQPTLPPKNSPSKSRSATPRLSATQRPRGGTKIMTPRSSSSATSTPDVTITTAETTIIESEIQQERIEQVPPEPVNTGPARIEITDYVRRKRKINVVDEPLIPKY